MIELQATDRRATSSDARSGWALLEAARRRAAVGDEGAVVLAIEPLQRSSADGARSAGWEARVRALESTLRTLPGAEGVVCGARGRRLIALCPGRSPAEGAELAAALVAACRARASDGAGGALPVIGLSRLPAGGTLRLETLVRVAEAGARVAGFRGPGSTVHTMLYDVVEDRVRRELGPASDDVGVSAPDELPGAPVSEARELALAERGTASDGTRPPGSLEEVWRAVAERMLASLHEEREAAPAAFPEQGPADAEEVDLLQRRIRKLVRTLEETEERLRASERRNAPDPGIASVFRTAQGLTGEEPDFEHKRALLCQVLEANLALRDVLDERRRSLPAPVGAVTSPRGRGFRRHGVGPGGSGRRLPGRRGVTR